MRATLRSVDVCRQRVPLSLARRPHPHQAHRLLLRELQGKEQVRAGGSRDGKVRRQHEDEPPIRRVRGVREKAVAEESAPLGLSVPVTAQSVGYSNVQLCQCQ